MPALATERRIEVPVAGRQLVQRVRGGGRKASDLVAYLEEREFRLTSSFF
jgi:hypothetical protein